MESFHNLMNACFAFMNFRIDVFGFDISMMEIALWGTVAYFLVYFMFSLFK